MDFRRYGILLMVAFLTILAPIGNAEESSGTNPPSKEQSTTASHHTGNESLENSDTDSVVTSMKLPDSVLPEETNETTSASVEDSIPSEIKATTTTPVPAPFSANADPTTSPVTNDHAIRDVTFEAEKCSTSFRALLAKEKDNWVPERTFLVASGEDSNLAVTQFCEHLKPIERLNALCNTPNTAMDTEDVKIAPVVAGLASMFSSICNDSDTRPNVTVGDSTFCAEFLRVAAQNCSSNPVARGIVIYPTQVLFQEMTRDNCTLVFNTKDCIVKALERNDSCSSEQLAIVKDVMTQMTIRLPCILPHSVDTANSTPTITTTTTPKTLGNAGTNFQVNFFSLLPVLLLAFNFY